MTLRIHNGQVILPADQQQKMILGRGVAAELRVIQLDAELLAAQDEIAALKAELADLKPPAKAPRTSRK